jgi:SAM-dependent methyltransferase
MDMRKIVEKGYDNSDYAGLWDRRTMKLCKTEKIFIDMLIKHIPARAEILDLGCGIGMPLDKHFLRKGYKITGIDISSKHIIEAKKNNPKGKYIHGDFSKYLLNQKFDAIISTYAIFHIPRTEHLKLFKKIHRLLEKEGIILVTMGVDDFRLVKSKKFIGKDMVWSSYDAKKNLLLIKKSGFDILLSLEDHNIHEHHLWVLAKKRSI